MKECRRTPKPCTTPGCFRQPCFLFSLLLGGLLLPAIVCAQLGATQGVMIELYGMVQVEPGDDVLTLEVKNTEIRFLVHHVYSPGQRLSKALFLSNVRRRAPHMRVRGQALFLETLLQEKPRTRVLELRGIFYPDSRLFVLHTLRQSDERSPTGF